MDLAMSGPNTIDVAAFARDGFLAPLPILTAAQCALILRHAAATGARGKGLATTDRLFFDVATRPALTAVVETLLGSDTVLWGVEVLERAPGAIHPWHVDIESAAPDGKFVSVWIGIDNTSRESALAFLARSHRFGKTVQQVQFEKGFERGAATDETIAAWGRALDPAAALVQPEMRDGDAVVFDGRLWHGSRNRTETMRTAILLQYAAADAPVRAPDPDHLSWPIRVVDRNRMASIQLHGKPSGANWLVNPPASAPVGSARLGTESHPLRLPLAEDDNRDRGWRPYPLFAGSTPNLGFLTCHVSVLSSGKIPHPPHAHIEEELLIVLDGEAELLISPNTSIDDARPHPVQAGWFAYYPAYQHHTLRNAGTRPVSYAMFKWRGPPVETAASLPVGVWNTGGTTPLPGSAFRTARIFEAGTGFLDALEAHLSEVEPGGGYEPHRDAHDVALVVFAGSIESGGHAVGPGGIVFHAAGDVHGLRNTGSETARYLVFEFHGQKREQAHVPAPLSWRSAMRAARRQAGRARRAVRRLLGAARPGQG
jgi:mannose-6-phosphate isomerase-like protein (cupin superfamily)